MPSRFATSTATDFLSFIADIAICRVVTSILRGLPPSLPLALALANQACVLSMINSRSNSASAANIPNTNLP